MSLFLWNSFKKVKKMIQRQKNEYHPSKNGHLTPKTLMKKHGTSKNMFWGQIPIFLPERSTPFFRDYDKLIEESS